MHTFLTLGIEMGETTGFAGPRGRFGEGFLIPKKSNLAEGILGTASYF
jgi:hypothetical protein